MDVIDSTGDGCSLCGGEGSVDGVRDNTVGPVVPEGQLRCNEMHQKTHVSLERPFLCPSFSGCPSIASKSSGVNSLSIGCPLILSGSILLSAVRLMERSMGSWRARKKSSGPRGRPGSEDNN